MRIAVTGATGNAGSALLRALADEPRVREVVGIARRRPAWEVAKTTWATADVSRDDLSALLRGADAVVHLAWLIQPSRDEAVTRATNVDGSRRVFDAAVRAGVPAIVHASSVGAYSPGPKDRAVDERHPTTGIPTSFYARHKAAVERLLDALEREHPRARVVRLRPGLIFQRDAASGIRRLFAGPLLPSRLVRDRFVPVVPSTPRLRFQAVHADDVADAYRRVLLDDGARGAFNVAAEPVLDGPELGRLLGARPVRVPERALRLAAALTWRARLQPSPEGWIDLALGVPLMDCSRARGELGWSPRRTAGDALLELLGGLRDSAGLPTPPLDPSAGGPLRVRELLTGIGRTSR
ncbi:MAG TPA: NAD-dependent epimerase/dehydratase family protein [Solirubrobacteraceae bacterium]|nr:NAD-dependent epimerase/dehydratase family protein [Solirubrobacteraceae bacterium]